MALRRVRFPADGQEPPLLEGELWLPERAGPAAGVVVAHPHPQRGGSMHSNVVGALCEGLQAAGVAWLRFNFRGVGQSEGSYGGGLDEAHDLVGALAFLAEQPGIEPTRVGLAGYSFGARVCLAVVERAPQVRALLCVAPPLAESPSSTGPLSCPLLVMVGDRDRVAVEGIEPYASRLPDGARLQVVQGTDHFWWGFESVLVDASRRFFGESLAEPSAGVST